MVEEISGVNSLQIKTIVWFEKHIYSAINDFFKRFLVHLNFKVSL